jgi:hypothetical protein
MIAPRRAGVIIRKGELGNKCDGRRVRAVSKDTIGAGAMTTAAEYRQYAEECLTAMRAAVIPEVRTALFTAAQRWNELADRIKRAEEEERRRATVTRRRGSGSAAEAA